MLTEKSFHVKKKRTVTAEILVDPLNVPEAVFHFLKRSFIQIQKFKPKIPLRGEDHKLHAQ